MNRFLLSVSLVGREFFNAINSIRQLALISQWRFHGSTVTLFSLLISFVNRELACTVDSILQPWLSFKYDFSFYSDSVIGEDFWISTSIVCLTIPCVKHESIFAIGFTRRSCILWRCRLHTSAATHITVAISGSTVTLFSLTISGQ